MNRAKHLVIISLMLAPCVSFARDVFIQVGNNTGKPFQVFIQFNQLGFPVTNTKIAVPAQGVGQGSSQLEPGDYQMILSNNASKSKVEILSLPIDQVPARRRDQGYYLCLVCQEDFYGVTSCGFSPSSLACTQPYDTSRPGAPTR